MTPADDEPTDVTDTAVPLGTPHARPAAPVPGTVPAAGGADPLAIARDQILVSLRDRAAIKPPLSFALLGGGLALMVVIGVVLSVVLKFVGFLAVGDDAPSFTFWFVLYALAMIALVVWQERRARNGFFTFASADVDLARDEEEGADYLLERTATHARSIIDGLLWPPRAFVAGLHAVMAVPSRGLDMILPEAADTLTLMLTLDGGVKIKDLAAPGTDPSQMMPVLKWLDVHDYIGISTKGDRVWVSSPAKKRFTEQGIHVPKVKAPQ